jgi:tetratricopeptide (TPR) repeat protein
MSKINQLQNLLRETPDDSFLNYALALEYTKINSFEEATIIFENLLLNDPDYLATYLHYGNLLAQLGQNEKAAGIYQKGIVIAEKQNKIKTRQEIEQALFLLD